MPKSALDRWMKERLFDSVPLSISIIDRNLEIVYANPAFSEIFGEWKDGKCFAVQKNRSAPCPECSASQAFADGAPRVGPATAVDRVGAFRHFMKHTFPVPAADGEIHHVVEIRVDLTEEERLRRDLEFWHLFLETLVRNSPYGIIALTDCGQPVIFNAPARELMGATKIGKLAGRLPGHTDQLTAEEMNEILPDGFMRAAAAAKGPYVLEETHLRVPGDDPVPVRLSAVNLRNETATLGRAVFFEDLRLIKQLEREKLDAERFAAVGQTLSALAHGIKNMMTGMDGGMYLLNTGLKKELPDRVEQGRDMLERNLGRVSSFVKQFLSFSKSRGLIVATCDPGSIVGEVIEVFQVKARELGISLVARSQAGVAPAPLDREGIHECLTNLVGNALDACRAADKRGRRRVSVRCYEQDKAVIYEVADDGCGMDPEVKAKAFNMFFTTKGADGTGLGLLGTRRTVQEHGGHIEVESEKGKGSVFRIILPRDRLPAVSGGGG